MKALLKGFFVGVQRESAAQAQKGLVPVTSGKDPMTFSFYRWLCLQFLCLGANTEFILAHCMLTLSWNLMCRVSNTIGIKYSHMSWIEDALGLCFAVMKNDQNGTQPRDPRHIYANPLQPEVCPILALAIYLLCMPPDPDGTALFPGSGQDSRFGTTLQRVFNTAAVVLELKRRGYTPDQFGTHSIRKGSATSGSTACPSVVSVARRAGWAMGTIGLIYLRYESAGDQFVGRTVTGLPLSDAGFASLPPFFRATTDDNKQFLIDALQCCFPTLPESLTHVAEFCLASLVYHSTWLTSHLPPTHHLFTTALFRDLHMSQRLSTFVVCRATAMAGDPIRATGVPPHVSILQRLDQLAELLLSLATRVDRLSDHIPQATRELVVQELEARAAISGTLTRAGMRQLLDELGLAELL